MANDIVKEVFKTLDGLSFACYGLIRTPSGSSHCIYFDIDDEFKLGETFHLDLEDSIEKYLGEHYLVGNNINHYNMLLGKQLVITIIILNY